MATNGLLVVNPYVPPDAPKDEEERDEQPATMWPEAVFVTCVSIIMFFGEAMVRVLARFLRGEFS